MTTTTSLSGVEALLTNLSLEPIPAFKAADVLNHPIDIYHSYLAGKLQSLVECDPDLVYGAILPANTTGNGDLDIVLPRLKLPGVSPKELADRLLKQIQHQPLFLLPFKDSIHIRFFFNPKLLPQIILPYINDRKGTYGFDTYSTLGAEKVTDREKLLVEFSSPNVARTFTASHLRSTILGAFVANVHEAMGWEVTRVNYLGDWGKHLGLLALGWEKYASERGPDDEKDLFRYILDLYNRMERELEPEQAARKKALEEGQNEVDFESHGLFAARDASFTRMEQGDQDAIALWKRLRDITVEYYVATYTRLNLKFDSYSGESEVSLDLGEVEKVKETFKSQGIYEEQAGSWVIDFNKHNTKFGAANLQGRSDSTTYLLRDIATVFHRLKTHPFDKMLYVVGEQDMHFRQAFKAVELMGHADIAERLKHITFSRASGSTHQADNIQSLGDILDQSEKHMQEAMDANPEDYQVDGCVIDAKNMGVNSLIVQELSSKKALSNVLGFSLMTELDGETGPALQICYARLGVFLANVGVQPTSEEIPLLDYSSLWEGSWYELLRLMAQYPTVVGSAYKSLDPIILISYIFRLVEELTFCLDEVEEEQTDGESSKSGLKTPARAVLFENTRHILRGGMNILGLIPSD